jgi:Patatin-like phospholipase
LRHQHRRTDCVDVGKIGIGKPSTESSECKTVEEAIVKYKTFSQQIFAKTSTNPTAKFDGNAVTELFKDVIKSSPLNLSPEAMLKDTRASFCKTFVVATRTRASGSAVRMRTYSTMSHDPFPARIWEAARATSAAPTFFDPIVIDDVTYGDGGTGWNNPAEEAIAEAYDIWPTRRIGCFVSLGTGLESALQLDDEARSVPGLVNKVLSVTLPNVAFTAAVAEYCVQCLTSCERIHRRINENPERLGLGQNYFRLNVPQGMSKIGLEEWRKLGDMIALTKDYMDSGEMRRMKLRIAFLLLNP